MREGLLGLLLFIHDFAKFTLPIMRRIETKIKTFNIMEENIMSNKVINVKELTNTKAVTTTSVRYSTPDGLIFTSREDYLDYVKGLHN